MNSTLIIWDRLNEERHNHLLAMTHRKPSNPSFRYSIARLKPLANVKVWGSLGIMALLALVFWQYYHHPEWVGSDQLPGSTIDGEVEGEVGNSVDIGVTVQDLEQNRLNSGGVPVTPSQPETINSPLEQPFNTSPGNQPTLNNNQDNPLFPPSADGNNGELDQQPTPSIKFQPLMPNVKNLGSLFPPLKPSKNSSKPIKIPDSVQDSKQPPQNNALQNALDEVLPQESPSLNPSPPSSQDNKQPSPNTNRFPQPNYPTPPTSGRNNPYPNQPYTPPNNPSQPFNNNPYTYTSPQPYSQPYGNGTAPPPVPAYPPSPQLPNTYGNANPNPNSPTQTNQNQTTPNYGIQPPQVNQYGGVGDY